MILQINPLIQLVWFGFILGQEVNGGIINIRNVPHAMIVLANKLNAPYQLALDYECNMLFFSTDTVVDFSSELGFINLNTNNHGIISHLPGGFASAVDGDHHIVYLGARDGIYKYDHETKPSKLYSARGTSVWQLFYKDNLYFTEHFTERAYVFTHGNGTFKEVPQLKGMEVLVLGVDKNNNIYFSNSSGLFNVNKTGSLISKVGNWNAAAFTTDIDGNLFFCTNTGLFVIANGEVILLASMRPVYGMAIARNGEIIYTNSHQIIKLQPDGQYNITSDYYRLLNIDFSTTTKKRVHKLFD